MDSTAASTAWDTDESTSTYEECIGNIKLDTTNKDSRTIETVTSSRRKSTNDGQKIENLRFYCLRNKVIVVMPEESQFCFTGKLIVKVLYGAVEAYGYVITMETKQPIEIYSPRGYSSVSIKTSEQFSSNSETDIWATMKAEGFSRDTKNKLVADIEKIQSGMAIVLLSNLENKLTKFLNAYCPFSLFPKIRNPSYLSWTNPNRAEAILQSQLYFGNYKCKELIIDRRVTQRVATKMLDRWHKGEWSCTLIAGGKGVGKSTATRCLINSLLPVSKAVVLVDVDPGQTECTPSGCVSISLITEPLMGPNFTHLKVPLFQLYIGDVNVTRCVTQYIEGIKMLADVLRSSELLNRSPIVVNTMGFIKSIGWDILVFTMKLIRPSFVVQIISEKHKNNFAKNLHRKVINEEELPWASWGKSVVDLNTQCDHELCVIRSHAENRSNSTIENLNLEPYQQRELAMISYLNEIVQNPEISRPCYHSVSFEINQVVPYAIPLSSLTISIPRAFVPPSHILNVINGNIVALCGIYAENDESQQIEVASGLRVLNRSSPCNCYGFGIVRGIDMERNEIFINTPLSAMAMQSVNYLVGCIPVPIALLQLKQHKNVPYTGGTGNLPTSREPRRGYFRMRYGKA